MRSARWSWLALACGGCASHVVTSALKAEISALDQQVAGLQARACADAGATEQLMRELVQVFPAGGAVRVERVDGWASVWLSGAELGAPPALSPRAEMNLDLVAGVLAAHPRHRLRVVGAGPSPEDGAWALALAAAGVLRDHFGVRPAQLEAAVALAPGEAGVRVLWIDAAAR